MPRKRLLTPEVLWKVNPLIVSAGFHKSDPGWLGPLADRILPDIDIWYVAAGSGEVLLDGKWHSFSAGELITLMPGQNYQRERSHSVEPFQVYYVHLLPFGSLTGPDSEQAATLTRELAAIWPMRLQVRHRPELMRLFDQLYATFLERPDPSSPALRGIMMQILAVVFEEIEHPIVAAPPRSYESVLRAKEFMEKSYAGDVSLAQIAQHADLSPSHLSALFKTHLGIAPVEFLLQVRIREAKRLLADGHRGKYVASAVGCRSTFYFSRLFKKKTGMTPTAFSTQSRRWSK